jgi:hypothetical protein
VVFREFRGWRPRYVDGRERWDWKDAPTILEYLRQAGEEGWELVSVGEVHNYPEDGLLQTPEAGIAILLSSSAARDQRQKERVVRTDEV